MIADLVIPMLDEAPNVPRLFAALHLLRTSGHIRHIVVGDNGSTDGSQDLVRRHAGVVVDEPRRGYGAACLKALDWIGALADPPDAVAFVDADLADDPACLPLLLDALSDHDLAIGCRTRLAEPGALNAVQRLGGHVAAVMMYLATGYHYADLGPMRAVTWTGLKRLRMADRTWGWTVEMQTKAAMLKMRIAQIDVPYRQRHSGKSKISGTLLGVIRAGWKIIITIWITRFTWNPTDPAGYSPIS